MKKILKTILILLAMIATILIHKRVILKRLCGHKTKIKKQVETPVCHQN